RGDIAARAPRARPCKGSLRPLQRLDRRRARRSAFSRKPRPTTASALAALCLMSLPISGSMSHVRYEWDDGKAAENLRKHGVDFMDAVAALKDPNRLEEVDTRFEYGEERVQVIGMARSDVLFVIVTARDDDSCRFISARKATRHEQDRYYAGDRETW